MLQSGFGIISSKDYARTRRIPSHKKSYIILLFLILIPIAFSLLKSYLEPSKLNISNVVTPLALTPIPALTKAPEDTDLKNIVQDALAGTKGSYGIVIYNLKNHKSYFQNENKIYDSASLYKLWVMIGAYQKIQAGDWKLSDVFSESVQDLNKAFRIDEKNAELKDGVITLSVEDALTKMIRISDNYAAFLLAKQLKLSNLQNMLNQYSFNNSSVGIEGKSPTTSAYDIYSLFSRMYANEFSGSENMLTLLKRQALNEKIPKNLPINTVIAHKTGELGTFSHDAGIVYSPNGDYIIIVLSDTSAPKLANERIVNLSKAVFEYFNKNL